MHASPSFLYFAFKILTHMSLIGLRLMTNFWFAFSCSLFRPTSKDGGRYCWKLHYSQLFGISQSDTDLHVGITIRDNNHWRLSDNQFDYGKTFGYLDFFPFSSNFIIQRTVQSGCKLSPPPPPPRYFELEPPANSNLQELGPPVTEAFSANSLLNVA